MHQRTCGRLSRALRPAAESAALALLPAVNVRLRPSVIVIPDIVFVDDVNLDELVVNVSAVRLICEIVSPGNPAT